MPANEIVLASEIPLEQRCQGVQFDGVGVLGDVVLTRDRPQHLRGTLVRLLDHGFQLARHFEIDCHVSLFPFVGR